MFNLKCLKGLLDLLYFYKSKAAGERKGKLVFCLDTEKQNIPSSNMKL